MTIGLVQNILLKLFVPVDKERVQKAKNMAQRQRIDWQQVLDAMTDEQRKQVENASSL